MSKPIYAIDCEMVGDQNNRSMVARVSVVNPSLGVVLDEYVKPTREVGDYRTAISGIRQGYEYTAKPVQIVREKLRGLLRGSKLVGHDIENDLAVLDIQHGDVRDLATYEPFVRKYGHKPSLKALAENELRMRIQSGQHNSVEDAKAAMQIYLKHKF